MRGWAGKAVKVCESLFQESVQSYKALEMTNSKLPSGLQSAAYTTLHVSSANLRLNPPQTPLPLMATATANPTIALLGGAGRARGDITSMIMTMTMTMNVTMRARSRMISRNPRRQARVRGLEQK